MSDPTDDAGDRAGHEPGGEPSAHRLRAEPDRPGANAWREPPWFPPDRDRHRGRERGPQLVTVVVGLGLVLIGVYYFLDRTLGIPMPPIAWGSLWPVLLIVLGALILVRSADRRR